MIPLLLRLPAAPASLRDARSSRLAAPLLALLVSAAPASPAGEPSHPPRPAAAPAARAGGGAGNLARATTALAQTSPPTLPQTRFAPSAGGREAQSGAGDLASLIFPNPEFTTGDFPNSLRTGDLDGDGHPDVVTADAGAFDFFGLHTGTSISILLNSGVGTLAERLVVETGGVGPVEARLDDLDGDGHLDIAVANAETGNVTVLLNGGDGRQYATSTYFIGGDPFGLALGDLDGDGDPDVAVTHLGTIFDPLAAVSVLLNDGRGQLTLETVLMAGTRPSSAAIGDIDHDGMNDIVVGSFDSGDVQVFLNDGAVGFPLTANLDALSGGNEGPASIELADLDGDGNPDILVGQAAGFPSNGKVTLFFGDGDGAFSSAVSLPIEQFIASYSADVAEARAFDVDLDGDLDIVAVLSSPGLVAVYLNDGAAGFGEHLLFPAGLGAESLSVVDMDGDGAVEIVVANASGDNVSILRGLGGGQFGADMLFAVADKPGRSILADVDQDGVLDLVSALPVGGEAPAAGAASILFGIGEGAFREPLTIPLDIKYAHAPAVADFDGDGDLDLAVLGGTSVLAPSSISIKRNQGGQFLSESTIALDSTASDLLADDLDSDGDADLIVLNVAPVRSVEVLLNHGDATFSATDPVVLEFPPLQVFGDVNPQRAALADVDLDGVQDLVILAVEAGLGIAVQTSRVMVMLGNGDATFQPPVSYTVSEAAVDVAVGDLTGDGAPDIAVAHFGSLSPSMPIPNDIVSLLVNAGDGSFLAQPPVQTLTFASALAIGDLDDDGLNDVAVGNSIDLSILLNDPDIGLAEGGRFGFNGAPIDLLAGDMDQDGDVDLVAVNKGKFFQGGLLVAVSVLLNQSAEESGPTLELLAPAAIGTQAQLLLTSPGDAGKAYFCGFSGGTSPGIPLGDGSVVPLNPDGLFSLSADPFNPLIIDNFGVLSGASQATVLLNVPNLPGIVGLTIFSAFVVLDPASPTGFGTISPALAITVVK